jgi:hypothetical protein
MSLLLDEEDNPNEMAPTVAGDGNVNIEELL